MDESTIRLEQEGVSFTDADQAHCLLQKLQLQRQKGELCDVTFLVGSHEIRAHRCVMAANSPVFDVELCNQQASAKLVISNQNPSVFMAIIEYLYSGMIVISKANVTELLKAANHYVMEKLKQHCCEFLEQNTTVSNCFANKTLAETYQLTQLTKNIEAFILTNLSEIIQQKEILGFPDHRFESFLSNKSMPLTEDMKFGLLIKWIEHEFSERNERLPALLQHIQWCQMNQMNIYTLIRDSTMFHESQWCMYTILQLLEDRHMISPMHLSVLDRLKQSFSAFIPMPSFSTSSSQLSHVTHTQDSMTDSFKGKTMHPDSLYENRSQESHESDDDDSDYIPVPEEESPVKAESYGDEIVDMGGINSIVSIQPVNVSQPPQNSETSPKVAPLRVKIQKSQLLDKRTVKKTKAAKGSGALEKISNLPAKKFKCSSCNFTTKERQKMQNHEEKVHRNKPTSFTCSVCEFTTTWNREFYKHMKEHFPGPPFHCNESNCSWSGERIQQLINHRMAHRDERPYACHLCSMKFRTKNNLNSHVKGHKGEKPFKCGDCEKSFATRGTLEQHRVTHSASRPYLCDTCGFSTKYQSHLVTHRRIHSGEVYRCQYPGCAYATPKRSQLSCHLRTHLSLRAHTCPVCGRGFVERGHLVRHQRIHGAEKPYACAACDYASTRADKLKEHERKYHAGGEGGGAAGRYRPRKPRKQNLGSNAPPTNTNTDNTDKMDEESEVVASELEKTQQEQKDSTTKNGPRGKAVITEAIPNTTTTTSTITATDSTHPPSTESTFMMDAAGTFHSPERGMLESQLRGALDIHTPTSLQQNPGGDFNALDSAFMGIL